MDLSLYLGNLPVDEPQYKRSSFIGLALHPTHDREIKHDLRNKFLFADESVSKIQSQDVFEHIEPSCLIPIFDELYRILKKDGVFRLSVPDYNSPYYRKRCVYDQDGNILADLRMGGTVGYDKKAKLRTVKFLPDGNSHVWFPTYDDLNDLISQSKISKVSSITFHHAYINKESYIVNSFIENEMPVKRMPPFDNRANGGPLSIIVDFVK